MRRVFFTQCPHGIAEPTAIVFIVLIVPVPLLPLTLSLMLSAAQAQPHAAVLLCDDDSTCGADLAVARSIVGDDPPITPIDLFLVLDAGGWAANGDQSKRFKDSIYAAQDALNQGRWAAVEQATDDALEALQLWPGTVSSDELFALYYLQGVARVARGKAGAAYSFREAAAMIGGVQHALPTDDVRFTRVWLDEARKLMVGGTGWIEVEHRDGVVINVDGIPMVGDKVAVLPGNHRLTATRADSIHTWQADVPVLAERTSRVVPKFTKEGDALWVRAQLGGAVDTLQAPVEVTDLLGDWCALHQVQELQILQVRIERTEHPLPELEIGEAPATRPEAADAEPVDMGDGVPSTFADAVTQRRTDAERSPTDNPRLKVVYFDATTRLFHADTSVPQVVDHPPEHFRIGASVGYVSVLGHNHASLDLSFLAEIGRFAVTGDLGIARSDTPYNLQPGWVDRQLYHVNVQARWTPLSSRVSPFVAAGPELYIPVSVGAKLSGGVEARFAPTWVASAEGRFSVAGSRLGRPLGWGFGIGVARTY